MLQHSFVPLTLRQEIVRNVSAARLRGANALEIIEKAKRRISVVLEAGQNSPVRLLTSRSENKSQELKRPLIRHSSKLRRTWSDVCGKAFPDPPRQRQTERLEIMSENNHGVVY